MDGSSQARGVGSETPSIFLTKSNEKEKIKQWNKEFQKALKENLEIINEYVIACGNVLRSTAESLGKKISNDEIAIYKNWIRRELFQTIGRVDEAPTMTPGQEALAKRLIEFSDQAFVADIRLCRRCFQFLVEIRIRAIRRYARTIVLSDSEKKLWVKTGVINCYSKILKKRIALRSI
jgi:hypothetical protein